MQRDIVSASWIFERLSSAESAAVTSLLSSANKRRQLIIQDLTVGQYRR